MAAETIHSSSRPLRARRLPTPSPAAAYAVRSGVAVTAAIWIGKAPGLVENQSTWILITVLMLLQPTTGASVLKALLRAVGTLAGAFTAIALFGLFAQEPPLLMAGLFLVQAIGAYGNSGPRFQYAWFVFAFTTAIVLGGAMAGQGAVETIAFQRASMVGIGILLVFVVDSLLWPARAEPRLRESLASRARLLGEALRRVIATPWNSVTDDPAAPAPGPSSLANQLALVDGARKELGVSRTALDALARLAMLLETLASRARVLATPIEIPGGSEAEGPPLAAALTELARRVEAALEEVAAAVTASRVPSAFSDDLEPALMALEAELDRLATRIGRSPELEGRSADLRDLVAVLRTVEATLSSLEGSEAAAPSGSRPRFRPDPFREKIALRTAFAVIAAFLVPIALGWPMNAAVAPVAFLVASLARGAALKTVASLATVLALGWAMADFVIVYVTPHLDRAPLALVVPFAMAVAFALIAARRPQLALLPSIGGLVAFLSIYGGTGAPTDVYGPYSTVCYMGLAAGIGWLFGRIMWPATAAGLFRQRVAAQLALCLEAVRGAGESGDAGRARRAAHLIQGFAAQSAQLGPLHQQALHEPVERALDPSRREQILALATDLMDAVLGDRPGALEPLLERGGAPLRPLLEALRRADQVLLTSMQAAVDVVRGDAAHRTSRLAAAHQAVEDRLRELRADPGAIPELTDQERRRLLIDLDSRRKLVFRQRAIEDWLEDWRVAEEGHDPDPARDSGG
jgi:uncharacterized membrane protein YccC